MAKNKPVRSLGMVGKSQQVIEKSVLDKFASVEAIAQPQQTKVRAVSAVSAGRINPQLSCTITPEDKELLNELALWACNHEKKMLNTSIIIRALIRSGIRHKDELVF